MDSCCGTPQASFPRPTDRRPGDRPQPFNNRRSPNPSNPSSSSSDRPYLSNGTLSRRRPTYFSTSLHRVSAVLQQPTLLTFRELALLLFVLFAAYKGLTPARRAYSLLFATDVAAVCHRGSSAAGCLGQALALALWQVYAWAAGVVPWGFVVGIAVFFGEEMIATVRGKT